MRIPRIVFGAIHVEQKEHIAIYLYINYLSINAFKLVLYREGIHAKCKKKLLLLTNHSTLQSKAHFYLFFYHNICNLHELNHVSQELN